MILDKLMGKLKDYDEVVLAKGESNSRQIKFSDNEIVKTAVEEVSNVSIFVAKNKKLVSTILKDDKNIDKTIRLLKKMVDQVEAKEDFHGINDKIYKYKEIKDVYDSKIKEIDDVDFVEKGINASLGQGVERTNGVFELHDGECEILTNKGIDFKEKGSEVYFSIRSFVTKDQSGHMNGVSRVLRGFDTAKIGKKSGEIARDAEGVVNGRKGKMDVIFSPLAFAPILNSIGDAASIFSVESGMSYFEGKLNKKLSNVTIYDDGSLRNGLGSLKADMEGVASRKNVLLDKGVFKTYLHNYSTAKKYGVESTGNAGLVSPEPWNVVIDKGNYKLDELIKGVKDGLLVTNVWYTRFANYATGDFSTIPRDGCFKIKNGKIVESWKGIRVSENVLNILKNVSKLGNEVEHLRSWEADTPISCPHVLVKNCNITVPTQ